MTNPTSSLTALYTASSAIMSRQHRFDARITTVEHKVDVLNSKMNHTFVYLRRIDAALQRMCAQEHRNEVHRRESAVIFDAVITTRRQMDAVAGGVCLLRNKIDALDGKLDQLFDKSDELENMVGYALGKLDDVGDDISDIDQRTLSHNVHNNEDLSNIQAALRKQAEEAEEASAKTRDFLKEWTTSMAEATEEKVRQAMNENKAHVLKALTGSEARVQEYAQRCQVTIHKQLVALTNCSNSVNATLRYLYSGSAATTANIYAQMASIHATIKQSTAPIAEAMKKVSDSVANAEEKLDGKLHNVLEAVCYSKRNIVEKIDDVGGAVQDVHNSFDALHDDWGQVKDEDLERLINDDRTWGETSEDYDGKTATSDDETTKFANDDCVRLSETIDETQGNEESDGDLSGDDADYDSQSNMENDVDFASSLESNVNSDADPDSGSDSKWRAREHTRRTVC
ncbi:hypothetical protein QBC34DRAFT_403600 [Podospora aff. communis PSN243]|uniref:Uncharacterized protein n=1 Tax=Podospora aff. communis PSN243 TaxID=3040156 RepID=A0AAV9GQ06_9PEZI|nr:hypothetical protein QBC34DRAFT_403600 [Podospora aff. communis PSN243]